MQVNSINTSPQYAMMGGKAPRGFQIANSGTAFKVLSDSLYSDKEMAVAREIICNAVDAHIAGNIPDPIEITLKQNYFNRVW